MTDAPAAAAPAVCRSVHVPLLLVHMYILCIMTAAPDPH
jgi:hypothetical protein